MIAGRFKVTPFNSLGVKVILAFSSSVKGILESLAEEAFFCSVSTPTNKTGRGVFSL